MMICLRDQNRLKFNCRVEGKDEEISYTKPIIFDWFPSVQENIKIAQNKILALTIADSNLSFIKKLRY